MKSLVLQKTSSAAVGGSVYARNNVYLKSTFGFSKAIKKKFIVLGVLLAVLLVFGVAYLFVGVDIGNERLFKYALKLRLPRLFAMILTAFSMGSASIVFQTVVNNRIVTPCLLGMNSLYTLIHTAVIFVLGSSSIFAANRYLLFSVDVVLMAFVATVVYSYFFKLTNYNVLYVLLIGTVMTSFFTSIQSTLVRVMDPNEYESLLTSLIASFNNMNIQIIAVCAVLMLIVVAVLRRDIALLDVISLGRAQAVNLGVDYDRAVRRLLIGVTMFITVATALVGPVSFMGLIIANLSRQLLRTYRHSILIAGAGLFGSAMLIGGQLFVERIFNYSAPISSFITVSGGIYFLYLILSKKGAN